jgi:hypothetical protein
MRLGWSGRRGEQPRLMGEGVKPLSPISFAPNLFVSMTAWLAFIGTMELLERPHPYTTLAESIFKETSPTRAEVAWRKARSAYDRVRPSIGCKFGRLHLSESLPTTTWADLDPETRGEFDRYRPRMKRGDAISPKP